MTIFFAFIVFYTLGYMFIFYNVRKHLAPNSSRILFGLFMIGWPCIAIFWGAMCLWNYVDPY